MKLHNCYHTIAGSGRLEVCRLLLHFTKDKTPRSIYGQTPLQFAANRGHLEVCKYMLKVVVDKNPKDDSGLTPLHAAANKGYLGLILL